MTLFSPPTFEHVDDERQDRKRRVAGACRIFAKLGFDEGVAGHVTVRDPEHPDHFWVNPLGLHFSRVRARDLLLVSSEGTVVEGDRPLNTAAFVIHSQIHAARPDVISAVHAHSVHGKAWSSLGRLLDPITQDACAFFQDHAVHNQFTGPVLELDEGKRIAATLGRGKAVILRNHGLVTVGQSVDEAAWWFISMERSCQAQLLAEGTGKGVTVIDDDTASATADLLGSTMAGWFSFQPAWQCIVEDEPDLLE